MTGSYDFSMRHGTRSGVADEKIPEYHTGDVWVSANRTRKGARVIRHKMLRIELASE